MLCPEINPNPNKNSNGRDRAEKCSRMKDQTAVRGVKKKHSSFPVTHKVGNVDICVQLLMRINWKWLQMESISIKIYIYHDALNEN